MNSQTATIEKICSQTSEIAAFIDGELLPREEIELELHLSVCGSCASELNEQKKLLCALDYALENDGEIELPANFTKIVVTNAESKVSGLRRPQERSKALFVCAALFLLVLLGLGGETETVLNTFGKFAEQFLAVGGFVWNLIYDVSVGTAIVLRSLGSQFIFNSSASLAILIVFVFLSLFLLSRFISAQRS
jgi:L-2-hydroxyglutarate oxidase LhgO